MAWYKSIMNARPEPTYFGQHPTISDAEGVKYSISGYSESHSSERYEGKTEQIFQFRGPLGMTDYEHSSPRKDMYKEHGMDGKPILVPWGLARPEKVDGISPKFRQEALRAQDNGSPRKEIYKRDNGSPRKEIYKSHSPSARDHEYGKHNYFQQNNDEYDTDDDDDHDHYNDNECVKNTKKGFNKQSFIKDEGYDHNVKYKVNGPGQTQPRKHTYYDNSYDELDLEQEKRKSLAPNYTSNNYMAKCPSVKYPKQESLYEKAPTYYNEKRKEKGNDDYTPPYTVTTPTIPRKETFNRQMVMPNPPPIRTRIDRGKDAEYYNEGKNSPHYNSPNYNSPSSRKDHQGFGEMIDSSEARRRYSKAPPKEVVYVAEDYTGVIDSRQAARRYNGVLLTS